MHFSIILVSKSQSKNEVFSHTFFLRFLRIWGPNLALEVDYLEGKSHPGRLQGHLEESPLIFLHFQSQFLLDLGSISEDLSSVWGSNFDDFLSILG